MRVGGGTEPPSWKIVMPAICHTISSPTIPISPPIHGGQAPRGSDRVAATTVTTQRSPARGAEEQLAEAVAQLVEVRSAQHLGRARPGQVDVDTSR